MYTNANSYTYVYNHKVPNDKPNETGINNCNWRKKDTFPLPNSCQTKCIIYQASTDCEIAGYNKKCYLGSCETTFKDRCSTTLNIKMIQNYQKNFGKSKSAIEYQKLHGKFSEYVVLTIQTASTAFYV